MDNIQFELGEPLPYLNTEASMVDFWVNYPSGGCYWKLCDSMGMMLKDGNYTFSEEVLSNWTDSDDVLIDALNDAQPWLIP